MSDKFVNGVVVHAPIVPPELLQKQIGYESRIQHWDGVDHVHGEIQGSIA
tara:strand:- start:511 stop:660 length:150 start_codon:yes stop_codon:yes gene_type:complete